MTTENVQKNPEEKTPKKSSSFKSFLLKVAVTGAVLTAVYRGYLDW